MYNMLKMWSYYLFGSGGKVMPIQRVEYVTYNANISNNMSVIQEYVLLSSGGKVMRVPFEYLRAYVTANIYLQTY